MARLPDYIVTIPLDSVGELTKSRWVGTFRVKLILTHDDQFAVERLYKQMLPDDKGVEESKRVKASVLAEIAVKVLNGPEWFEGSNKMRNMIDEKPIVDLITAISNSYREWVLEVEKAAVAKEEGGM